MSVGADHDTAATAVATIARWWQGSARTYPTAKSCSSPPTPAAPTAIAPGCGRPNSSGGRRGRAAITVCHFPPGTSKWNKIEHRLFSHISSNWRGQTLASHEVVVNLIAATITRTGLTVHAELDHAKYPKGIKISDRQIRELESRAITRHDWHGEWNYTLTAAPPEP